MWRKIVKLIKKWKLTLSGRSLKTIVLVTSTMRSGCCSTTKKSAMLWASPPELTAFTMYFPVSSSLAGEKNEKILIKNITKKFNFSIQTIFHDELVTVSNLCQSEFSRHHLFNWTAIFVPRNCWIWHSSDFNVHDNTFTLLDDLSLESSSENRWENWFCDRIEKLVKLKTKSISFFVEKKVLKKTRRKVFKKLWRKVFKKLWRKTLKKLWEKALQSFWEARS